MKSKAREGTVGGRSLAAENAVNEPQTEAIGSQKPVRVARVIDRLNIGGPAKHVVWLTVGLDPQRFETVLITGKVPAGEGDMSYFAHDAGIEPVIVNQMSREISIRDLVVVLKLLRQFWRVRPDIVHTHKAKAGAVGRVAAVLYRWITPSALWLRPRRCRIVHTYHGHVFHSYYSGTKTRAFLAIERTLARLCTDRIIVVSEQQRREISETFRVGTSDQYRVVPLGLDLSELMQHSGDLRSELGRKPNELVIGIVGRLCEVKNHGMFLDVAAGLTGESEGETAPSFVVVGDGHLRGELEQQAMRLGISDSVTFTGFRNDAASLYGDMDVVALTSLNEGTPLTLIEAMGCGRPVVSTEVGGVADIMGERRETGEGFAIWDHGLTVPSGDIQGFARALRFLMERPELRREMGERGRAFVRSRMSRTRLARQTEEIYQELVGMWQEKHADGNKAVFNCNGEVGIQ
jgi:glycosyltransferase involved in cell wall biosynthesis